MQNLPMPQQEPGDNLVSQMMVSLLLAVVYEPLKQMVMELGVEADQSINELENVLHQKVTEACLDLKKAINSGND